MNYGYLFYKNSNNCVNIENCVNIPLFEEEIKDFPRGRNC